MRQSWWAAAAFAIACAAIRPAAAAGDGDPLHMPPAWNAIVSGVGIFASWKNGNSTYYGHYIGGGANADSTESILRRAENPAFLPARTIGIRHERLTRCGTTLALTTTRFSNDAGGAVVREALDYAYDGAWYIIDYDRPDGPADPNVERILHETCPDDLPFAVAPGGWQDEKKRVDAVWVPKDKTPGTAVQLSASANDLPPTAADAPTILGAPITAPRVRTTESCGIPLLIVEGTSQRGGKDAGVIAAISQDGSRRYVVRYEFAPGAEDPAVRAAVLALCAKAPLGLHRLLAISSPAAAQSTPEPVVTVPVRLPKSFRSTLTRSLLPGQTAVTRTVQLYAANGSWETTTTTTTDGAITRTTNSIGVGDTIFQLVAGTWYDQPMGLMVVGGSYPDFSGWHGTLTQGPDENVAGVPVHVYHIAYDAGYLTVWIGSRDQYVRRIEEHSFVVRGKPAENAIQYKTFDRLDEPIAIEPPRGSIEGKP